MEEGPRVLTEDREARQEAIIAPRQENVRDWTGAAALEAKGSGLVRD